MPDSNVSSSIDDPVQKMNRMYRWTRHVYDLSRRYYLLGRDEMLEDIAGLSGGDVLEVGCGTARNLRVLDDWAPQHTLYGLDASLSMLATARSKLECAGCTQRITLRHGLAQSLDPEEHFGTQGPFDIIFFSYVLSMIPSWQAALRAALTHLAPDGRLYVVDFWDQDQLPEWMADALHHWLSLFDVRPRPAVPRALNRMSNTSNVACTVEGVAHRYAYRLRLKRSGPLSASALDALDDTPHAFSPFGPASQTDRPPEGQTRVEAESEEAGAKGKASAPTHSLFD